jgi:hypothetical protein
MCEPTNIAARHGGFEPVGGNDISAHRPFAQAATWADYGLLIIVEIAYPS